MADYEVVIGLEIHAQLSTNTKLFCACDNDAFGAPPNSRVCAVCLGFPGTLPRLNEAAVEKSLRAGATLGCELQGTSKFDRKNYFYPDLPYGYQISQYDQPVATNGKVELADGTTIRIHRLHLENDAGKLVHQGQNTLLDFNRAGTPLVEIVTEPDLRSAAQAATLAREIQRILRHAGASEADMEKGMMRFDASVSLRPMGDSELYPRTEIKNLNSFSALERALEYEIAQQLTRWQAGDPPQEQVTVGWVEDLGRTQHLRDKEDAHDYRYFPEPDLPPLHFSAEKLESITQTVPELPLHKKKRYQTDYQLSVEDAETLVNEAEMFRFFEAAVESDFALGKRAANLLLSVISAENNWEDSALTPAHLSTVVRLWDKKKISSTGAKEILLAAMESGSSAEQIMTERGLEQVSDTKALQSWVNQVVESNPQVVADIQAGKDKALGFLVGQVMKLSAGAANPEEVRTLLQAVLKAG